MRRRARPANGKAKAKRASARKSPKDEGAKVRELEKRLAEAQEQQAATAEILRVISTSPTDVQPVYDAIMRSAVTLCDAILATVYRREGDVVHLVAIQHPHAAEVAAAYPAPLTSSLMSCRAIRENAVIHLPDVETEGALPPEGLRLARLSGFRSVLSVPLRRDGHTIGAILIGRPAVGPFPAEQIALLQTFADQAVIAIENVRLFNETKEVLEQQTATGEILRVISSSPTDVQPVLDVMAESAARLCEAADASIFRVEGDQLRLVAQHGAMPHGPVGEWSLPLVRQGVAGRSVIDARTVHLADMLAEAEEFPVTIPNARRVGFRTMLSVPLVRDGVGIGAIQVFRGEPRLFSERQVALLQSFADQAVIAIENVRLFTELQTSNRELTTTLDQQTATSDILKVISSSPTDVQPVFDAIVRAVARLCHAVQSNVQLFDGQLMHYVAHHNIGPVAMEMVQRVYPMPPNRNQTASRAILDRTVVHVPDVLEDPEYLRELAVQGGWRGVLSVPMVGKGQPIGVITVTRMEPGWFSETEIGLLQTFADQAVIAIENVRLFTELQQKNEALTQAHVQVSAALDQQTATSDILRVISSSPTDEKPVFDAIAQSSVRLCGASFAVVAIFAGEMLHVVAHEHVSTEGRRDLAAAYPMRPNREQLAGRAILDRRVIHVADVTLDPDYVGAPGIGNRATLSVPMLRTGAPIGAITIGRFEPVAFTDQQIELLQTFADQAVIAIENVRLFTELQTSNRELTAALDTQTATSDILRVISRSGTDVQPVFDTILASATRLLGAYAGLLTRRAGEQIEIAALTSTDDAGDAALRAAFPHSLHSEGGHAQVIRDRAPLNVADAWIDPRVPEAVRAAARVRGNRSLVVVPLLRHDEAVGAIGVTRRDPGGFTDDEIALLETFADQAVIAIENARLLSELQARTQELTRSVDQLTALGDVGRAVSSSLDLDTVLTTIVGRAVQLSGTDGGTIFEYDESAEEFSARATLNADEGQSAMLRATRLRRGEGAVGQMAVTREPLQIADIAAEGAYEGRLRGALLEAGTHAVLAIPLLHETRLVGGLVVTRRTPGEFTGEVVELLRTFATQSALAIQNARLFREIEIKSRELEVASQHKSEFLASMSHELRTPLNAIIGFSDVLLEGMFGDTNEKQTEYLRDILASGQHLLSLINDILDLSKIEAGRMELDVAAFDLPAAIDDAMLLMRERAGRRGIALERHVDERVGEVRADQRKVKQVLLNLLSNAVKFTPEGGRIDVRAAMSNGTVEISVTDTGIGIAPEDQDAVFEEFRQVGKAEKKAEGTGLGLALCRKFVDLHGGRIWVKSQVDVGSTFTFTLPLSR